MTTVSNKKTSIQMLSEKDGEIVCDIDLSLLEGDWFIKMEILNVLRGTFLGGSYFKFAPDVQEFVDSHQQEYDDALLAQSPAFKIFRRELLSTVKGALYEYVQRVQEIVLAIYRFKDKLGNVKLPNVPVLTWSLVSQADSDCNLKGLNVKNLNVLDSFDKLLVGDFFAYWVDSLNFQEAARRKEFGAKYYELARPVRRYVYQGGKYWSGFKGKDYVLTGFLRNAMCNMDDERKIFQLMYIVDAAVNGH